MRCDRCDDMREQVRWLEKELAMRHAVDAQYAVARAFRITPGAATMLARLYAAAGGHVASWQLLEATAPAGYDDDRDPKTVSVRICIIRRAMGPGVIETLYGKGYRLTDVGMARVAAVLPVPAVQPSLPGKLTIPAGVG